MELSFVFLLIISTTLLLSISLTASKAALTCGYGKGGSKVSATVVVDQSGKGNFKTVQAAVDSIPLYNNKWIKIQINAGTYVEKVSIPINKPCIYIQGQGRDVTKITYDAHAVTDLSATFSSSPDNIVVKDISFENSYNLGPKGRGRAVTPAVAARVYGDKLGFYDCGFLGVQDTVMDVQGRHYFSNCYIEGAIDFIFGNGQSLYEDCWINATVASVSSQASTGIITAQARASQTDRDGFVFLRGTVSSTGPVLLGRGYRPFSRVIFQDTNLNADVVPQGWDAWNAKGKERFLMYSEVNCKGRGSDKSKRVKWEKEIEPNRLKMFSKSLFVDSDEWIASQP